MRRVPASGRSVLYSIRFPRDDGPGEEDRTPRRNPSRCPAWEWERMARDLDIAREYTRRSKPNPRRPTSLEDSRGGVDARGQIVAETPSPFRTRAVPSGGLALRSPVRPMCPRVDGAAIFRRPLTGQSPNTREFYRSMDGPCAPIARALQRDDPRVRPTDLARRLLFTRVFGVQNRFVKALGPATPPSASCARSRSGRFFIVPDPALFVSARLRRQRPRSPHRVENRWQSRRPSCTSRGRRGLHRRVGRWLR